MLAEEESGDTPVLDLATVFDARPSRYAVLGLLLANPQGTQVAELSSQLGLDASTVRHQLKALMKLGVVTNDADPYFPPQGQRPKYVVDRQVFLTAVRDLAHTVGATVVDTADDLPMDARLTVSLNDLRTLLGPTSLDRD